MNFEQWYLTVQNKALYGREQCKTIWEAIAALQAEAVAIKAKPLEWEKVGDTDWHVSDWGFHIDFDAKERDGQQYSAAWGEGDAVEFATLEEAQQWCQETSDSYMANNACVTHLSDEKVRIEQMKVINLVTIDNFIENAIKKCKQVQNSYGDVMCRDFYIHGIDDAIKAIRTLSASPLEAEGNVHGK